MTTASTSVSPFNFGTHAVRVVMQDGEPWFVAKDVCEALGYRDAEKGTRNLGTHQKGTRNVSTPGGEQRISVINESGLYRLVLRSRKPEAEKFSDWVTGEVLPAIRKTGQYRQPEQQPLPAIESKTVFCTPEQRAALRRLIYQGSNLHFSGRLADSHRAQCTLLIDVKFGSKELRVKAGDFEAAKQFIADYFAEEVKLTQPSKPQPTNAVSIPPGVLEVASDMAGQVFSAVVKQATEPYSRFARFFTDIDFDKLQVNTSKISNECYALTMDEWPSAIKEEASIKQTMSIMNACIEKLNRHHGKAIAA